MKSEIKIELPNKKALKDIIQRAYYEKGSKGKISGKKEYLKVNKDLDKELPGLLSGLNNATIKITNSEIIDGHCRFLVDETHGELRIYPISIYCVSDDDKKFIFY